MAGKRYRVIIKPSAARDIRKLDRAQQQRVVRAIEDLAEDPLPHGVVKLRGADDLWRIRVGDYRVIYPMRRSQLIELVLRVRHRRDVYRP